MNRDPVCGMLLEEGAAAHGAGYGGELYLFCSSYCKEKFFENPWRYVRHITPNGAMKRIAAYVNTTRVHWVVEELEAMGVGEIVVTEHFRPNSQISRLEFVCEAGEVERFREVLHRVGTIGELPDHYIDITDFDPDRRPDRAPGASMSPLE